ncbi:hypothetical protein ACVIKP_001105 [Rhizobium leguminosarum]
MQGIDIVHHQVRNIEVRSLVARLQGEMQLPAITLQDHEADRISVLEYFLEAEDIGIKIVGFGHVLDWQHGGNSSETNTVIGDIIHRRTSGCEDAHTLRTVPAEISRFDVSISRTVPTPLRL